MHHFVGSFLVGLADGPARGERHSLAWVGTEVDRGHLEQVAASTFFASFVEGKRMLVVELGAASCLRHRRQVLRRGTSVPAFLQFQDHQAAESAYPVVSGRGEPPIGLYELPSVDAKQHK